MGLLDRFKKDSREQSAPKKAKVVAPKKTEKKKEEIVPEVKEAKEVNKVAMELDKHSIAHKVLLHPLISEKAARAESHGVYSFVVNKDANKFQIKQAITAVYKVKPIKIRVVNMAGKIVRRGRASGKRSEWKKAIVTLPAGQSMSIHEGV